ncbi:MAG: hypothetical protein ACLFRR_00990 [Spirochaetaceae bacterium]
MGERQQTYYGRGPAGLRKHFDERARRRGGLFGGNRSLTIIFIDIVIIVMLYAIFAAFLAGGDATRTIDGYRFSLTATRVDEDVVATVRVDAREEAQAPRRSEEGILTVLFPETDASEVREVKDVLPLVDGEARLFQHRMKMAAGEGNPVEVRVEALGRSFTLRAAAAD